MGIEKTKLDDEKIKNILQKEYGINVSRITKIKRGTSNIFKIDTKEKSYILKEFVTKRKKDTILKEVKIIEFLKQRNINVPTYLETKSNDSYIENEGRIIIVQDFINGDIIENNTGNYKQTIECASILGKLVREMREYKDLQEDNIIKEYFSKDRVHNGIEKMKKLKSELKIDNKYKEQIIKDLNYKIKISEEIDNNFDFDIINKLTILNSHGDFCSQQLIYNNKLEPTIIDFEKAQKLPVIWEIMRSFTYIDKQVKYGVINVDTLVDYFKEFNRYIKLNKYDLEYAPYVYLLQLISSTYGYKEYNNDYEQEELIEFAFFRTNICRELYKKAKEISVNLSNKIN